MRRGGGGSSPHVPGAGIARGGHHLPASTNGTSGRLGRVDFLNELVEAIEGFIARWNDTEAHPFRWT